MKRAAENAVVLMSGGIDSSACAYHLLKQTIRVKGLFVDYGQAPAVQEEAAARLVAKHLDVELQCIKMAHNRSFGSGEIIGRNAFLIFAALLSSDPGTSLVAIGAHAGNEYYDCSVGFFCRIEDIVEEYTDGTTKIVAPFLTWTKRDVVNFAKKTKLPIALTYSCEEGHATPCGQCRSCCDRIALGC